MAGRRITLELDEHGHPLPSPTTERCTYHSDQLRDHEQRIRILEKAWMRAAGAAGILAGVLSFAGAIVAKYLP
jgi:hypothetical protein